MVVLRRRAAEEVEEREKILHRRRGGEGIGGAARDDGIGIGQPRADGGEELFAGVALACNADRVRAHERVR